MTGKAGDTIALAKKFAKNGDEIIDAAKVADKIDDATDAAKAAGKINNDFAEFPKNVRDGAQGKHIVGHNNYQPGKSIVTVSNDTIEELVNKYSGTGEWLNPNKEHVDFGQVIGKFVDIKTGKSYDTTVATVSYSGKGVHIVPAKPNNWRD